MKAAQAALLKYAYRQRDTFAHYQHHQDIADELNEALLEADALRRPLIAAAWASLGTDAEKDAFQARIEAIDLDFFVE